MTAAILDGKHVADASKQRLKQIILERVNNGHRPPGLAVILLGHDPASRVYVHNKRNACIDVGFKSLAYDLPTHTSEQELLDLIENLNQHPEIDGILVQLPLPAHINQHRVITKIMPHKDVDGFHPYNMGQLAIGNPQLRPCTPYGIIKLLQHYAIALEGQHAVVIGASTIVGRPMALELLLAKSTVTVCHRQTRNLSNHIRQATLLIVAAGQCDLIHPDWLNETQAVVDVGIHRLENGVIRGDLDFNAVKQRVAWITPVPGGVGPMTLCTLLENTLQAQRAQHS